MVKVSITDHRGNERFIDMEPGGKLRIGRSDQNDIAIPDPSLSRLHAEIYDHEGSWMLQDLKSRNGVFVNGRRIDGPVRLEAGAQITLGTCKLMLEGAGVAPAPGTVTFSDGPLTSSGTVVMSAADAMQTPRSASADAAEFGAALEKARNRFLIVERANLELLAHEPMDVLMPKILDLVSEAVKPERAALLLRSPDDDSLECRAFHGNQQQEMSISRTIANTVIQDRVSVLTSDAGADDRFADGASIIGEGIKAVMAVPLWNSKEVIGLIYADSRLTSGLFDDEDLRVATMLANIAAIQIENARLFSEQLEKQRFEREAKAAADIQGRLLPRTQAQIPGYLFVGHNTPCYECGGDYYDCLKLGDDRTGIVLADVAGKGMGAAMLMAVIQATLRARAEVGLTPRDLVDHLGDAISRSAPSNRYATLFFIDLDHTANRLRYVNAGHAPSPLLVRTSGELEELKAGGTPLGLFPGFDYPVVDLELSAGDFIFACSDGVTDLEDPDGEMFGEERLTELLVSLAGRPTDEIRTTLDTRLGEFAKETNQTDDLTYVILQRSP